MSPFRDQRIRNSLSGEVLTERDQVVSVSYDGDTEVFSLQTETGNYVAWGYLSKNCSRYAYIVDWKSDLILFSPNVAQQVIADVYAEAEESELGIWMQYLKGRQLGISTDSELHTAHRAQFFSNVNAVVASSDPDKSATMAKIIETVYANEPWFLVPTTTKYKSGVLIEFGGQNSGISIQHGTQFTGIARGTTPTVVHASELSDFSDPASLVDASLLRAMHSSPWIFLVLESPRPR